MKVAGGFVFGVMAKNPVRVGSAAIRFDLMDTTGIVGGMGHVKGSHQKNDEATAPMTLEEAVSPYKAEVWRRLTPGERLRRSWAMRSRIPDLKALHDSKLFPKP
jgi:hypothetical protein